LYYLFGLDVVWMWFGVPGRFTDDYSAAAIHKTEDG